MLARYVGTLSVPQESLLQNVACGDSYIFSACDTLAIRHMHVYRGCVLVSIGVVCYYVNMFIVLKG